VDLKQILTLRDDEVARVTRDYGGKGFGGGGIRGQHRLLIGILIIGGLLTLVFVAVASDQS